MQVIGDEKVNDLGNYVDIDGIQHIYVIDDSAEWELIDGEWVEKAPF